MKEEASQPINETQSDKIFLNRSKISSRFVYRVWFVIGAVVLAASLLILLWQGAEVFLLVFAGLLLAVFLRGIADWTGEKTGIPKTWSLAIVLLTIIGLIAFGVWFLYPSLETQFGQLSDELPQAVESVRRRLSQTPIGRRVLDQMPTMRDTDGQSLNLLGRISGYFSTFLGGFVDCVIVLVVGIYFALAPQLYYEGFLKLFPDSRQKRVRKILDVIGHSLQRWLVGRLVVMAINGLITGIVLWILGVPLAIPLGILTALLNFIPNIGPFLAAIPAVLLALMQSPALGLYTAALFLFIQALEGYVLEPLVQQKAVFLPPVLVIAVQLLFGILFGFLGVLLAVPLMAIVFILVRMIYVEDILGHEVEIQALET